MRWLFGELYGRRMVGNINFRDASTGDQAWAGVRVEQGAVGLALSLSSDGDIEVLMDAGTANSLIDALLEARRRLMGG